MAVFLCNFLLVSHESVPRIFLCIEPTKTGQFVCASALRLAYLGVSLDIENYCTIRASPACQRRFYGFCLLVSKIKGETAVL
ncbi:Mobile element protein (plasmid) [Yersinia enterocolitica]|nr:Mobile element protein [Yersinia enterocolitica]